MTPDFTPLWHSSVHWTLERATDALKKAPWSEEDKVQGKRVIVWFPEDGPDIKEERVLKWDEKVEKEVRRRSTDEDEWWMTAQ